MRRIFGVIKKNYAVRTFGLVGILVLLAGTLLLTPGQFSHAVRATGTPAVRGAAVSGDVPTYMGDNARSGFTSSETRLNSGNATGLKLHWQFPAAGSAPAGSIDVQPVIVGGVIYVGTWDGYMHAIRSTDGTQIWQTYIGKTLSRTGCSPANAGVAATATVSSILVKGTMTSVVFVPGGDDQFYALDAFAGSILWSTPLGTAPDEMLWAGAAVSNGNVYVGISSYGDCPLTPGHFYQLDATTGAILHTFNTTANNCKGGGIWDQPTIDEANNAVYITTGTISTCKTYETMSYAILKFSATDLTFEGSWQVPISEQKGDGDFGSTASLFTATINGTMHELVGAVNKNGYFYALDRSSFSPTSTPTYVWRAQMSTLAPKDKSSISTAAWDGANLYAENSSTTINGQACGGSVRKLDPATGAFLWEYCGMGRAIGGVTITPTLVIAGIGAHLVVLDKATGTLLSDKHPDRTAKSWFWGTATISNGVIYVPNRDGYLYAYGL